MDFRISLACSRMMMECPRCGFVQPKDQYCAKCGLDVDHYTAKPKPIWVRIAQNPNVHLSLIVALIVLIVGYIIYSRAGVVQKQVGRLFGTPISSRDAGEPGAKHDLPPVPPPPQAKREMVAETVSETAGAPAEGGSESDLKKAPEVSKVEITSWEVPRDVLGNLVASADNTLEASSAGRAYFWKDGAKAIEKLTASGRRFSTNRSFAIENGAQLAIETPPTTPEAFQFGLYFQVNKSEGKDLGLKWESTMVLPQPEPPGAAQGLAGAQGDAQTVTVGARQPSVKALTEAQLSGSAAPTAQSAILIVYEPTTRALRDEALAKAGDGPWTIFGSYDFRSGATEWVMLVQLK